MDHHLSPDVNAMNLNNILGKINTNHCNLVDGQLQFPAGPEASIGLTSSLL